MLYLFVLHHKHRKWQEMPILCLYASGDSDLKVRIRMLFLCHCPNQMKGSFNYTDQGNEVTCMKLHSVQLENQEAAESSDCESL